MSQEISLEHTIYSVTDDCPVCHVHQTEPALQCLNCNAILVAGLRRGTVIANTYEYICPIGTGGMGLIVKAVNKDTKDEVAVKLLLRNTNASDNRRFQQEAKAASMLSHKNIVDVYDFGFCEDESPYMVMDYVVGENLAHLISQKGSLSLSEALHLFDQICDAMSFAHSKGVIHRDLKPSNIMLSGHNRDFVKIVDFGIAKILDENSFQKNLTHTGQVLGSPLYMSPEQALGRKVDTRTDIYSAGCVLFHALTGAPPIEGSSSMETLFKHLNQAPLTLSEASLGKKFPPALEEIVAKTLRKEPGQRYQSFDQLKSDLRDAGSGRIAQASVPGQAQALRSSPSATAKIAIVVACIGVLLSAGSWFWITFHDKRTNQTATVAQPENEKSKADNSPEKSSSDSKSPVLPEADDPSLTTLSQLAIDGWTASQIAMNDQMKASQRTITLAEDSANDRDLEFLVNRAVETKASIEGVDIRAVHLCTVSDEGLKVLARLPLKELTIDKTVVTGRALETIGQMKSLEELHLHGLPGTNPQNVAYLGKLKNLKILDLSRCEELAGSDLAVLSSLPGLTTLDLSSMQHLGDDGVRYIAGLPHLAKLTIGWTKVHDPGLEQLGRVKSLRTLSLEGLLITDKGLKQIAKLPQLWNLNLSRSHIDSNAVKTLSQFHTLNKLYVWNCPNLQEKDITQLKAALGGRRVLTSKPSYKWDTE